MKTITDEQLNIEICGWCGWRWITTPEQPAMGYWERGQQGSEGYERTSWINNQDRACVLPNHITGIEALGHMNEAERRLNAVQYRIFADTLWELARKEARTDRTLECYLSADARTRAIALLGVVKPELFQ